MTIRNYKLTSAGRKRIREAQKRRKERNYQALSPEEIERRERRNRAVRRCRAADKKFAEYEDALCAAAKEVQGELYAGDDYYRQGKNGPWRAPWEDGISAHDAVMEDMSYWGS